MDDFAVETWSEARVAAWLKECGLQPFANVFMENNITGDVLLDLTHELLREMEINSVGERMRVLIAVKKLRKAMAHGRGGSARIGGEATPMKDRPAVAASATRKSPAGMSEVRPAVIVKQQTSAPVDALQRPVSGTTNGGRKNSKGLSIQTGHSGDANAEQHVVQVQPASATGALSAEPYTPPTISSSPFVGQSTRTMPRMGSRENMGSSSGNVNASSSVYGAPLPPASELVRNTSMVKSPSTARTLARTATEPSIGILMTPMTPTTAGTSGRERRVVRIIGELKESRIVDVGELTDPRLIYGKILQKFDIVRDRTDLATIEREMERWVLVLPGAGAEGDKPVTAQELVALGVTPNILNPRDTESIPKLYLRKRNHAPAYSTLTTKDLQRKMAKLENFFGTPVNSPSRGRTTPSSSGSKPGYTPHSGGGLMDSFVPKLRAFFGDNSRPASESITGNLDKFFPAGVPLDMKLDDAMLAEEVSDEEHDSEQPQHRLGPKLHPTHSSSPSLAHQSSSGIKSQGPTASVQSLESDFSLQQGSNNTSSQHLATASQLRSTPTKSTPNLSATTDESKALMRAAAHGTATASIGGPTPKHRKRKSKKFLWVKGALIGTGSFGSVYLGLNRLTGEFMAVKQVQLPDEEQPGASGTVNPNASPASDRKAEKLRSRRKAMADALQREIELLEELENPYIVRYLGSERQDQFLNIFLEYVPGGSVSSMLKNYGVFEEDLIKVYVRQILLGLTYLHGKKIVHRDIKSGNILVDNKGCVKITDFGISKKVPTADMKDGRQSVMSIHPNAGNRTSTLQGSVFWMAPEVVKYYKYSNKADIWSLGCLLLEMLTNDHPWPELNQMQAMFKIGSFEAPPIPESVNRTSTLYDFLQRCFTLNYKDRANAQELFEHPFLRVADAEEQTQVSIDSFPEGSSRDGSGALNE